MAKMIIAGIKTEYEIKYPTLRGRSEPYFADFPDGEAQIKFKIRDGFFEEKLTELPQSSIPEIEYFFTGEAFYNELIELGGMMLHSSCIEKDGRAYLFSANSGTGKSTHTHLWLESLENTRIINDDKPALMKKNGVWHAFGTPFSGKTDENVNTSVPVRAIIFLERGEETEVDRIPIPQAIPKLLQQTIKPYDKERAGKMLELVSSLLSEIPVFRLKCTMNSDAAEKSYNGIERLIKNEN